MNPKMNLCLKFMITDCKSRLETARTYTQALAFTVSGRLYAVYRGYTNSIEQ